jgi:hypothetical protein
MSDDETPSKHCTVLLTKKCSTCIFRPGNKMDLSEGRFRSLVATTDENDSNVICHQSEGVMGTWTERAWCAGSVERRPGQFVRILERLRMLREIHPDEMK